MKRIAIFATVFLGLVAASFGQHTHDGKRGGTLEDHVNHKLDKMDQVVKFTGTQRGDLQVLFMDMAKRKKDAFCANEMGSNGMKTAMKSIRKDQQDGIKKVLSDDQMKLWNAYKKEKKAEHTGKGKHDQKGKSMDDRIDNRLNKMDEVVKFTGTQRDQMKALFTDMSKKKKDAICANEMGSDGMKSALRTIHEDQKEGIKKILTEDQMKAWKDHQQAKKEERKNKTDDKKGDQKKVK